MHELLKIKVDEKRRNDMNDTKMKVKIFNENDEPWDEYGYCKVPLEKKNK